MQRGCLRIVLTEHWEFSALPRKQICTSLTRSLEERFPSNRCDLAHYKALRQKRSFLHHLMERENTPVPLPQLTRTAGGHQPNQRLLHLHSFLAGTRLSWHHQYLKEVIHERPTLFSFAFFSHSPGCFLPTVLLECLC